jgi:hypothetical protein
MKSVGEFPCAYRPPTKHKKTMTDPMCIGLKWPNCNTSEDPHLLICSKTITQIKKGQAVSAHPRGLRPITYLF